MRLLIMGLLVIGVCFVLLIAGIAVGVLVVAILEYLAGDWMFLEK